MEQLSEILNSDLDNEEKLKRIESLIEQNYVEKSAIDEKESVLEQKYMDEIQKLKDGYENEKKQAFINSEIQKCGGKNTKAITALLEDSDVYTDETGKLCVDLSRIMESDPYLFTQKSEKVMGTGAAKSGPNSKKSFLDYARKGAGLK